jgi:hypothetical protein
LTAAALARILDVVIPSVGKRCGMRSLAGLVLIALVAGPWSGPLHAEPGARRRPPPGASTAANPLSSVMPFVRHLERALDQTLSGASPGPAFAPYAVQLDSGLLGKLRRARVRSVRMLLLELEVTLHPGPDAPVTMFKLGVTPWPRPALGQIQALQLPGTQAHRATRALSTYTGTARPLADVVRSVLKKVAAGRCAELPLVNPADWAALLPTPREQADLAKDTAETRTRLVPACRKVAPLIRHPLNLTPDDLVFGTLDATGKLVGHLRIHLHWQGSPRTSYVEVGPFFPRP